MASRIDIHVWPLDPAGSVSDATRALLSPEERARMDRFVFDKDRVRFAQSHEQVRRLLGARLNAAPDSLVFAETADKKPYLVGHPNAPFFNLSHSHNLGALGICADHEIGLDIEFIHPVKENIAQRFFSASECAALEALQHSEQEAAFFRCWTRKEAYVKAQGQGLAIPLNSFDVTLGPNDAPRFTRIEGDDHEAWTLWSFVPAPGYQGALAIRARAEISLNVATSG